MIKQSKMRDMRPIQEAASRALWQACNKPDLCRHAVAIVVSREVAEWDTPLTFNQEWRLGVFATDELVDEFSEIYR
jgi:hypothetical protein